MKTASPAKRYGFPKKLTSILGNARFLDQHLEESPREGPSIVLVVEGLSLQDPTNFEETTSRKREGFCAARLIQPADFFILSFCLP